MPKYLDPKADLTFKKVFAEHKNLLISLLNALLPFDEDQRIEHIEYWPSEKVPRRTEFEKNSIVDVCCRDNRNREFLVEMQMTWYSDFKKRVLLNAAKAYVAQSEASQNYGELQPVYSLNFINSDMKLGVDGYYHYYKIVHSKDSDEVIDGLQLIFIELPKFKPETVSEKKMQVLWLRFLTEINSKTAEAPAELLENPELSQALNIVEISAYSEAQMRSYDQFWDRVSIGKTVECAFELTTKELETAVKKIDSVEKELDRTVKERDENARERDEIRKQLKAVVENLSSRGMDENEISKLTGISSDEIKKFYEYRSDFCSVIP